MPGDLLFGDCNCCGGVTLCDLRCDPDSGQTHEQTDRYSSITVSGATGMLAGSLNGTWIIGPESEYRIQDLPGRLCMISPDNLSGSGDPVVPGGCYERFQIKRQSGVIVQNLFSASQTRQEMYQLGASNIINHIIFATGRSGWAWASEGYRTPGDCFISNNLSVVEDRSRFDVNFRAFYTGSVRGDRVLNVYAGRYLGLHLNSVTGSVRLMVRTSAEPFKFWVPMETTSGTQAVYWNAVLTPQQWVAAPNNNTTTNETVFVVLGGLNGDGSYAGTVVGTTLTEARSYVDGRVASGLGTGTMNTNIVGDPQHIWELNNHTYTTCQGLKLTKTLTFRKTYSGNLTASWQTTFPGSYTFQQLTPYIGFLTPVSEESPPFVNFSHPDTTNTQNLTFKLNPTTSP